MQRASLHVRPFVWLHEAFTEGGIRDSRSFDGPDVLEDSTQLTFV